MPLVKTKRLFVLCAIAMLSCSPAIAAKPTMLTAPVTGGQLVVDQTTGAISYCVTLTTGGTSNPTPVGMCAQIGTATPAANNPSFEIGVSENSGVPSGATSFVTNVYSGQVTQCEYYFNSTTHSIAGSCALVGTVP